LTKSREDFTLRKIRTIFLSRSMASRSRPAILRWFIYSNENKSCDSIVCRTKMRLANAEKVETVRYSQLHRKSLNLLVDLSS
jgi:hypothetical protein